MGGQHPKPNGTQVLFAGGCGNPKLVLHPPVSFARSVRGNAEGSTARHPSGLCWAPCARDRAAIPSTEDVKVLFLAPAALVALPVGPT